MSTTLGMPSATPSNAAGKSGVAQDQVGHIGKGILGTIEEGVGGTSSKQFYYGTGSAFFQAPSGQRSYGDDIRSFNVKTFGSRGMVNLARRWFEMGPTELFFTYPINYAWAGPEYHVRPVDSKSSFFGISMGDWPAAGTTPPAANLTAAMDAYLGELGTEMRSGPNVLPTYFWSQGVGFAFLGMIELNMGGGGNIIFDRYANFALVMASCPTVSMRQDLMRLAGGGLYYDHETDYRTLPVKFGPIPILTDSGTAVNRNAANSAQQDNGENASFMMAPVEWHISVPLKTPQTNFWNSLLSRKPIDTSCFASDLQVIISLANFFEISDTGTGLAHCPYYYPPGNVAVAPSTIAADVIEGRPFYHPNQYNGGGASTVIDGVYTDNTTDRYARFEACSDNANEPLGYTSQGTAMFYYAHVPTGGSTTIGNNLPPCLLPPGYFYTGFNPQRDFDFDAMYGDVTAAVPKFSGRYRAFTPQTIDYQLSSVPAKCRYATNPRIWANHYRVCNGFIYGDYGAPRPKFAVPGVGAGQSDNRYMKDINSLYIGNAQPITYAPSFTRMEHRNRSFKLTNPALSARLPLQSTPQACVYYPFAYAFSQTYRIPPSQNPYDANGFKRWCSNLALQSNATLSQAPLNVFQDSLAVSNKITQNIIMPANPVTSMIVGIYREKDRKHLGMNSQGTYSPVLFWNALNPVRSTLYDGGNILFDYTGPCNYEFGSLVDRPDMFRIPFRGGLCQLDPQNILPSTVDHGSSVAIFGGMPNGLNKLNGYPYRTGRNQSADGALHPSRWQPIHCTEWYNCHLLEFPFCMNEPLAREGTVQSTPSFAKTILRLEFYIDPLLKPSRGLDDMYDLTTHVPTYWISGEWEYLNSDNALPYNSYDGTATHPKLWPFGAISFNTGGNGTTTSLAATSNVANSVPNAYILDSPQNFDIYSDDREMTVQNVRGNNRFTNPYYTMNPNASSWNINNGGLLIQVNFLQNQVWVISPLRTSILSSRG